MKRTGEEKVLSANQTALTILPCDHVPACGKRLRHFPRFVFFFSFSCCSSLRTMRNIEKILPQCYAAFDGLHSFVHLRAPRGSRQMTLFWPLRTLLLHKTPFAMMIHANGHLALVTTWYSTVCLCFEPLLTQRSRNTRATCVRGKMRLWVNTEHLSGRGSQLASHCRSSCLVEVLAVSCTVVLCVVRAIGTVLFATKVCTVHVGHCSPASCTSG